jgi:hypothetical protein
MVGSSPSLRVGCAERDWWIVVNLGGQIGRPTQTVKIDDPSFLSLSANQSHHVAPATFPRTAKFSTWIHQDPPNQKEEKDYV